MSALKEFADFIILNMANLAATYAQLLAESNAGYEIFPADSRITSARKLLKAVISAYESQTSEPLIGLFEAHSNENLRRWAEHIDPPHPLAEIECLGQTLTPVVTNLEAGKFLWDILLELRTTVYQSMQSKPVPPVVSAIDSESNESVQRYKELVNDLPVGIYRNTPGPEGHFLEANPAIVAMFEADTTEEFLQHNVSDLYQDPKDRERFSEKLLRVGYIRDEELRLKTLKGREIWGSVTAVMKIDDKGQSYFDGLIVDITERKRAEELSRESEERYRLLLDSSPDPIVTYDNKGQVVFINSAFTQTFGWTEDELLGKRVDFVPEENWPETKDALDQLSAEGRVLGFETRRLTKDGRILDVQQSGAIIKDKDGYPTGSIIFIRDITELKVAQESAQRQARREQAIREITEKMRAATTLDELVKTTTEALGERLSAGHAIIELGLDSADEDSPPPDNGRE